MRLYNDRTDDELLLKKLREIKEKETNYRKYYFDIKPD